MRKMGQTSNANKREKKEEKRKARN